MRLLRDPEATRDPKERLRRVTRESELFIINYIGSLDYELHDALFSEYALPFPVFLCSVLLFTVFYFRTTSFPSFPFPYLLRFFPLIFICSDLLCLLFIDFLLLLFSRPVSSSLLFKLVTF